MQETSDELERKNSKLTSAVMEMQAKQEIHSYFSHILTTIESLLVCLKLRSYIGCRSAL